MPVKWRRSPDWTMSFAYGMTSPSPGVQSLECRLYTEASLGMEFDSNTAAALLSALTVAHEHDGALSALEAGGIQLPPDERLGSFADELAELLGKPADQEPVREALALGLLAGRMAQRQDLRTRRTLRDSTWFLMDRELVVQAAKGESILRLPWFEENLFVGRPLPDISEIPTSIRRLAIENYRAGLAGIREHYAFTSYGHTYLVDVMPVYGEDGSAESVLAVAAPCRKFFDAVAACEDTRKRLDRSAALAELAAKRYRVAGRPEAEAAEQRARKARDAAERASAQAESLRQRAGAQDGPPSSLTPREAEILSLASHGLTYAEIADELVVAEATVKTHLSNVYSKFVVKDKAAAVAAALRHGLID